jgi:hypothetical protein
MGRVTSKSKSLRSAVVCGLWSAVCCRLQFWHRRLGPLPSLSPLPPPPFPPKVTIAMASFAAEKATASGQTTHDGENKPPWCDWTYLVYGTQHFPTFPHRNCLMKFRPRLLAR